MPVGKQDTNVRLLFLQFDLKNKKKTRNGEKKNKLLNEYGLLGSQRHCPGPMNRILGPCNRSRGYRNDFTGGKKMAGEPRAGSDSKDTTDEQTHAGGSPLLASHHSLEYPMLKSGHLRY